MSIIGRTSKVTSFKYNIYNFVKPCAFIEGLKYEGIQIWIASMNKTIKNRLEAIVSNNSDLWCSLEKVNNIKFNSSLNFCKNILT